MTNPKIKLLKEIDILQYKFKIKYHKKSGGASFRFDDLIMHIGTVDFEKNPEFTFALLMHEISEAVHCVLKQRYSDPSAEDDYKFFMDHKQFEAHNSILSTIMYKFIS